jgi:hypothetical protein
MVLTVSFVLSPVTGLFCHRRQRIKVLSAPGRADLPSLVSMLLIAHGPKPALQPHRTQNAAASTASRAASVTIAIRPFVGGMAKVLDMIWGEREAEYFCKGDWTHESTSRPTGKSPHGGESKFRSCELAAAAIGDDCNQLLDPRRHVRIIFGHQRTRRAVRLPTGQGRHSGRCEDWLARRGRSER